MCFLLFDCPLEIEVQKEKKEGQFELKEVEVGLEIIRTLSSSMS